MSVQKFLILQESHSLSCYEHQKVISTFPWLSLIFAFKCVLEMASEIVLSQEEFKRGFFETNNNSIVLTLD